MEKILQVQNIKAKECCCGCTLRTGSLIILWIALIASSVDLMITLPILMHGEKLYEKSGMFYDDILKYRVLYSFIASITLVTTSILGIISIQKNVAKLLTPFLYCIGYNVVYCVVAIILALFDPSLYLELLMGPTNTEIILNQSLYSIEILITMHIGCYLFVIAMLVYFWIIIRSCREAMLKNIADGKDETPDPYAVGYNKA